MYDLTKQEKLKIIKDKIKEINISAYEIAKNTSLTEAGIGKIINGTVKNPHENTLNSIIEYLNKRSFNENFKEIIHIIEEPKQKNIKSKNNTIEELKNCLEERNNLTKEIIKLQILLNKNNIPFKNIFEED
jgi:predicted transcriptional regulator